MNRTTNSRRQRQSGLVIVEFTVIASVMLVIFFVLFEAGRYVYSLQMLNEATRRAARLAAVCHVPASGAANPVATSPAVLSVLPSGFSGEDNTIPVVQISYLKDDGTTTNDRVDVWFVRASINTDNTKIKTDYLFFKVLTSFNDLINLPDFATTVRAEGLGVGPSGDHCPTNS